MGAVRMQRDVVDPAPFGIAFEFADTALGVERDKPAVVGPYHDATAVRSRAEDSAAANLYPGKFALLVRKRDAFLGADKGGSVGQEMHRCHGCADCDRAHALGGGGDGSRVHAALEAFHQETIQLSKP